MTVGERAAIEAYRPGVETRAVVQRDGRAEVSRADGAVGCPWYDDGCTVYPVRPGVCRAYGCFRRAGDVYTDEGHLLRIRESAGVRRVQARLLDEADAWTARCG